MSLETIHSAVAEETAHYGRYTETRLTIPTYSEKLAAANEISISDEQRNNWTNKVAMWAFSIDPNAAEGSPRKLDVFDHGHMHISQDLGIYACEEFATTPWNQEEKNALRGVVGHEWANYLLRNEKNGHIYSNQLDSLLFETVVNPVVSVLSYREAVINSESFRRTI